MTLLLSSALLGPAFLDPEVARLSDEHAQVRAMLEVEAALARAQARLGMIPGFAGEAITTAASALAVDIGELAQGVLRDGVPVIALVAQLRAAAGDSGVFVHQGATSQDIMDTAMVLCVRAALAHMEATLKELAGALGTLARAHRHSVMAARTHGQQALPTTFGLKVAGWGLPLARHRERLAELRERFYRVQLGGAAGTLAAFGPRGLELSEALASELGLRTPDLPWHTARDGVIELGAWLTSLSVSVAKMAQDVILLGQSEVAEVFEAPHGARGGSSSMPQKNNPMRSEQILAAARCVSALLAALHSAGIQEHERGTHGWQLEWLTLPQMLQLSAGALQNGIRLVGDLDVHPDRMRRNLLSNGGLALGEAVVVALSAHMPRPEAQALVKACAERAQGQGRFLVDVAREQVGHGAATRMDWTELARPEGYLGQANALLDRALARLDAVAS